ncbi:MAG: sulfatase [Planctomycetales bacterium]|nr:sulfatase [Planctomycetales bacterium]
MKTILALFCAMLAVEGLKADDRPNIVFIAIDDLNDWIGCLAGHPQVQTPNLDRLASRGCLFRNAHCQVPVCMASRVSVFSGKLASTTGCYEFNADFHQATTLESDLPIPLLFKRNGYMTLGGGKLLHSGFKGRVAESFDVNLTQGRNPTPSQPMNWPVKVWDYGAFPESDEEMGDYQLAEKAAEFLMQEQDKPFFLATGFHRPHVPLLVPPKWFDLYDRDTLMLPEVPDDDMDDIPISDITRQQAIAPKHSEVVRSGKWRDFVHSYLACISFVDHCVGVVADAALDGPNGGNTLIVLWSDHGWHLGEKQHWAKRTLWEESTRTPLIFAGKGVPQGATCDATVGLVDIYPSLIDIAGLNAPQRFDGQSLAPFLNDPNQKSDRAVLCTWLPNNHVVIQNNWRYIHYKEGTEELYDLSVDPGEFKNLANDPDKEPIKRQLASFLPAVNAPLLQIPKNKVNTAD